MENIILKTDSYKTSHWKQYEEGTENVFSFFESRGGVYGETTFFGLQYLIKRHLEGAVVTDEMIDEAKDLLAVHFDNDKMFNEKGWRYIVRKHGGKLPVEIKAVPEGTTVPVSNVLMTIEATDKNCFWLTNYLETLLSQLWYPTTVATQSRQMKKTILEYLALTGDPSLIDFKLHDFGYRGVSSEEQAQIGGAAHLVNFLGTDTLAGIMMLRKYYGADVAGFSVPAAEHSTITSWGREREVDACENMLEQYPTGLVSVVSDSFDIFEACRSIWGERLKEKVLNRDGVLVVRPDSGDPVEVLKKVFEILGEQFGTTMNEKGYKLLHPKVRVIQGDGIDRDTLREILVALTEAGWSADNITFGSGGGLLQKVNRDTQKFAFKCCAAQVNGEWRGVIKDPVTDPGKKSKKGRLALVFTPSGHETVPLEEAGGDNLLQTVFRNGELLLDDTLEAIRERANVGLEELRELAA